MVLQTSNLLTLKCPTGASLSQEPKKGCDTFLVQIHETRVKPLRSSPEIVTESEKFKVSYPEDQSVHQTVDACTLKLGATAVLH